MHHTCEWIYNNGCFFCGSSIFFSKSSMDGSKPTTLRLNNAFSSYSSKVVVVIVVVVDTLERSCYFFLLVTDQTFLWLLLLLRNQYWLVVVWINYNVGWIKIERRCWFCFLRRSFLVVVSWCCCYCCCCCMYNKTNKKNNTINKNIHTRLVLRASRNDC